jgi:glutamate formiminotransferase/formiminotetrahydrofolate cyclodeaminase
MNLTDIQTTPLHVAFDAVNESAFSRGMRVTGTEIVGMVPLRVLTDAGKHFLKKQNRSVGLPDQELIKIAIKSMGLDDLCPFEPNQKIIEYKLSQKPVDRLISMKLNQFTMEVASESPAPGGGSVAAYIAACGVALATMVANLSSHKRGWDDKTPYFSDWAEKGESIRSKLIFCVDSDTEAFNRVMEAFGLPKSTPEEKELRSQAIQKAQLGAVDVPLNVMKIAREGLNVAQEMVEKGNPNSVSDAGVGANALLCGIYGAYLNVLINLKDLTDRPLAEKIKLEADGIYEAARFLDAQIQKEVLAMVLA